MRSGRATHTAARAPQIDSEHGHKAQIVTLKPGEPLHVTLAYGPGDEVPVGRLAIDRGRALFEYDEAFVASRARINPAWGQPNRTVIPAKNSRAFKGLHGIFADSLPDAWGLELMRGRLAEQNVSYDALNALDRLALVGTSGLGALVYRPDYAEHADGAIDLDALAAGAIELDGTPTEVLEKLAVLGGSSGGARPKVFVARNTAGAFMPGSGAIEDGYEAYMVKFRGSMDRHDIGPLEAAYADIARAAGIEVAPTCSFLQARDPATSPRGVSIAGLETHVIRMLSVAAIIETDWSEPAIDYVQLIAAARGITGIMVPPSRCSAAWSSTCSRQTVTITRSSTRFCRRATVRGHWRRHTT